MLRQARGTTLGARLQASWREASRVGRLALDAAYRAHAAMATDLSPIHDGWQVVDSDSLSDSDEVAERDVASDNDGLFDTEPVVGGYGLPDLDSASDQNPGTSSDGSDAGQSFYEAESDSAESDSASGTYYDARSTFDDGPEDEQLPSSLGRSSSTLLVSPQPDATESGLCSPLEQSQTFEVESTKGKGRAKRYRTPSPPGGFPLAQPKTSPSLRESPFAGLSRRSPPSTRPRSVSGSPRAGSSSAASSFLGGQLGAWAMAPARPESPPIPPWPPVPPPTTSVRPHSPPIPPWPPVPPPTTSVRPHSPPIPSWPPVPPPTTSVRPHSPPIPPWPPVPPPATANFDRFDPKLKAKITEVRRQHRADRYRTDPGPSSASPDSTMAADEGAAEPNTAGAETRTPPAPPLSRLLEEFPPLQEASQQRQSAPQRDPPRRAQPAFATRGRPTSELRPPPRRPGPRSSPRLPTRRALPAPPPATLPAAELDSPAAGTEQAKFLGTNSPRPARPYHQHHHQQRCQYQPQQQHHQHLSLYPRHPNHPNTSTSTRGRGRPDEPTTPMVVCMNPGGESPYGESMQGELREAVGGGGEGSGDGSDARIETLADGRTRVRGESFVGPDGWRYWMWEYV